MFMFDLSKFKMRFTLSLHLFQLNSSLGRLHG